MQQVEETAKQKGCTLLRLVTTNDTTHALGAFTKEKGYQFSQLYVNAVEQARKIKPEIPLVVDNGIPIRDEILLVKSCEAIL